jgi:hypothetical protein
MSLKRMFRNARKRYDDALAKAEYEASTHPTIRIVPDMRPTMEESIKNALRDLQGPPSCAVCKRMNALWETEAANGDQA